MSKMSRMKGFSLRFQLYGIDMFMKKKKKNEYYIMNFNNIYKNNFFFFFSSISSTYPILEFIGKNEWEKL